MIESDAGRYRPDNTPIHTLDARVKIVVALLLIVGIMLTPDRAWPAYPLLWALIGSLAAVGRIGALRLARWGGIALPFALAAVTLLVTTPGRPLVTLGTLMISDAGMMRFAAILLKSWLSAQVSLLLAATTPFTTLLEGLQLLGLPRTLILITAFLYRYLFTVREEADRLRMARASRSAISPVSRSGGSVIWRAQVAGSMIGNLFLRSYERSERVYAAMLARGFDGRLPMIHKPPLTCRAVCMGVVPLVGLILIEILALWWRGLYG
jgi:cobalt/nickel transport system permease protein